MIKGKEKRKKKYISLMMVPYNSSKIRSFRISHLYAKLIFVVVVISLAFVSAGLYIDKTQQENARLQSELHALNELNEMQKKLLADQDTDIEKSSEVVEALLEEVEERDLLIATQIEDLFRKYKDIADQYIVSKINTSIASRSGSSVNVSIFAAEIKELQQTLRDLKELASENELPDFDISEGTAKLEDYLSYIPTKWPLDNYTLCDNYGLRIHPITSARDFHNGLDLGAPYNSNVYASGSGTVTFSAYSGGYGNVVMIDHGYGLTSVYAHCKKLLVKRGDKVKQGDLIAYVGSTGSSTGPHTHFEIKLNGSFVDPLKFLD